MFNRTLLLAAVLTISACSDVVPSAPRPLTAFPDQPTPGTAIELAGIVELSATDLEFVWLRSGTERYALEGPETGQLWRVAGAEIRVAGELHASSNLVAGALNSQTNIWVKSFRVLRVGGRDVVDGVVISMDGGYALRLDDGSMFLLDEFPEDLAQRLGSRIWFAVRTADAPPVFGVIVE